jgi:hypothetical protein
MSVNVMKKTIYLPHHIKRDPPINKFEIIAAAAMSNF